MESKEKEELVDEGAEIAESERGRTCIVLPFGVTATVSSAGSVSKWEEGTRCDLVEGVGGSRGVRRVETSPHVENTSWSVACLSGTSHPSSVKVTVIY